MDGSAIKMADIFDNEAIIGGSTLCKVGGMRVVLSKDAVHEYHFLVMPIRHVEKISEMTEEESRSYKQAVSVIEEFYKRHSIDSYKEVRLSGEGAGQTIRHLHWHYVPGGAEFIVDPNKRPIHYDNEPLKQKTKGLMQEFERIKSDLGFR